MTLAKWEHLLLLAAEQVLRAPRARAYWTLVRKFTTFLAVTKQPPPRAIVRYIGKLGDNLAIRHPHLIREALKATVHEEEQLIPHLPAWIGSPFLAARLAPNYDAFPTPSLRLLQSQEDLPSAFYCPQIRCKSDAPRKVLPTRGCWTWEKKSESAGWELERAKDTRFFWTPGAPLGSTRWFRIKKDPFSSHRTWSQWGLQQLAA